MEELLKDLIAIRSDVNGKTNESQLAQYIENRLSAIEDLTITRQQISDQRWNILVQTPGEPKVLLTAHMDTVPFSEGWTKDPWGTDTDGDKVFGLGAIDPKGSIAAIISTLEELSRKGRLQDLLVVFYCGEEYDLIGMKTLIDKVDFSTIKLAIAAEPTGTKIGFAHRGLVEVEFSLTGKTGNAALGSGVSASKGLVHVLANLEKWLSEYSHSILGTTSMNIASIKTGLRTDREKSIVSEKHGNIVPDYGYAHIEIRTVHPEADADSIEEFIKQEVVKQGLTLESLQVEHNLYPLFTNKKQLSPLVLALQKTVSSAEFLDPKLTGWADIELLSTKYNIPAGFFGPSGGNLHSPDEWVSLKSITSVRDTLVQMISPISE